MQTQQQRIDAAYTEGWQAYRHGRALRDNPYSDGDGPVWVSWSRGYMEAKAAGDIAPPTGDE